jgi:hypothetical protein
LRAPGKSQTFRDQPLADPAAARLRLAILAQLPDDPPPCDGAGASAAGREPARAPSDILPYTCYNSRREPATISNNARAKQFEVWILKNFPADRTQNVSRIFRVTSRAMGPLSTPGSEKLHPLRG